jgi:CRISPR/Cas system CSM-associated protein Csm2 small subunit
MIDLAKEILEDRISTHYKKVLDLLKKEKPALAYTLGRKIVENRLNL